MKKIKLLLASAALLFGGSLWAQTDVTSTYITNADFSTTDGWTQDHSSQYWSLGNGLIGTYAVANEKTSTTDGTHLDTEYCFGIQCRWSTNYASFQQTKEDVSLPAGAYIITFDVQNTNTSTTSATYENHFYVKVGETTYSDTSTEWMSGNSAWTTHTISFSLEEAITDDFMISLGYGTGSNNFGSGSTPHLYVSHLSISYENIVRPSAVAISSELNLTVGGTSTLTPVFTPAGANTDTSITWVTSDNTVASVVNGVVTAVGPGSATITATTANDKSATCDVTVTDVAAAAAPAFYSDIAAGDFYLVNVATGTFLGTIKEGWGTQAGLADHGISFTVAESDGKYTLNSHVYNNASQHFFNGTYVDGNSTDLFITSLGSGKYSISTAAGSEFVTANTTNSVVANNAPTSNSVLAQWYFLSKDDLENILANATKASPKDATFYIGDPDFSRNQIVQLIQNGQTTKNPGGETYPWDYTVSNYHFKGGDNGNMNAESYHSAGTVTQALSVINGKYVVKCQGFQRVDSGSEDSYLIANDEQEPLAIFNGNGEGTVASMNGASASFSAGLYNNQIPVYVSDGSLTIGIKGAANNWSIFDNFELYYYGPIIGGEATEVALSTSTALTAGKWYYFDITVDGDYDLTATTLGNIVYTTDGTILIEDDASVTATFGSTTVALTSGRYYVKSSSAQSFAIAPHSFSYELGTAVLSTADGGYTQNRIFTVTFPEAATNDPGAELALVASSKATVNGVQVALSAVTNGFSLDLDVLLPGAGYVITIPAGVYGYEGQSMNSAISLTLYAPEVFDGEYVLYNAATECFLARGGGYGTEAVADKYGVPVNLVTNASGVSSFQFVDNDQYLFCDNKEVGASGIYTDGASTGWSVVSTEGGYYLKDVRGNYYAKVDAGSFGYYLHTVEGSESAAVWTLKTKSERDAIIAGYPAENMNNVITASGISTTAGEFESFLSDNYNAIDCTSAIGTATFTDGAGSWTWTSSWRNQDGQPAYGAGFAEVWNATGAYTQTIGKANLPAGIYKVTVQGYERRKANDAATALYAAGYNLVSTFLSANGEQVRFTDWNDVDGKPTNTGGAVTAFGKGEAVNTVYVYLDGNTDLNLTVRKPNYIWDCWMIMNNFTLTRYEQAEATMAIGGAKYATFVAPFDVTIPSGVTAYTVDAVAGDALTMTEVTGGTIDDNTPVVVYSESAVNETFKGKTIDGTPEEGLLVGTYERIAAPNGKYVLQNGTEGVGFYLVDTSVATPYVPANRAYLNYSGNNVKAFFFGGGEDAIKSVFDGVAAGEIYDLSGRKVAKMQKGGAYIVNGKKVIVK